MGAVQNQLSPSFNILQSTPNWHVSLELCRSLANVVAEDKVCIKWMTHASPWNIQKLLNIHHHHKILIMRWESLVCIKKCSHICCCGEQPVIHMLKIMYFNWLLIHMLDPMRAGSCPILIVKDTSIHPKPSGQELISQKGTMFTTNPKASNDIAT